MSGMAIRWDSETVNVLGTWQGTQTHALKRNLPLITGTLV